MERGAGRCEIILQWRVIRLPGNLAVPPMKAFVSSLGVLALIASAVAADIATLPDTQPLTMAGDVVAVLCHTQTPRQCTRTRHKKHKNDLAIPPHLI